MALVIGNGAYQGMTKLDNPPRDAAAIGKKLTALGFTVAIKSNQSKVSLEQAVEDFSRQSAGAEVSLLFYAGHGIQVDGRNYLIPVDAQPPEDEAGIHRQAVDLEWVVSQMRRTAQVSIIFLDACRNNPGLESHLRGSSRDEMRDVRLAEIPRGKILVLYSAGRGQKARDGEPGTNSPFARALLAHLDDREPVQHLVTLVSGEVGEWTAGKQEPELQGTLNRLLYLAGRCPPGSHWRMGQCHPDVVDECPKGTRMEKGRGCVPDVWLNCPAGMSFEKGRGCVPIVGAGAPLPALKFIKVTDVSIELLRPITFAEQAAGIDPSSFEILDEVVAVLKARPLLEIHVEGHSDLKGKFAESRKLSEKSAQLVRSYLIANGIGAPRLTSAGYGMTRPQCVQLSAQCDAQNRRIELLIMQPRLPIAEKDSVAVLGFIRNDVTSEMARSLTESLRSTLPTVRNLRVEVPSADLKEVTLLFGCSNFDRPCMIKIAKVLGVHRLIYGLLHGNPKTGLVEVTITQMNLIGNEDQQIIREAVPLSEFNSGGAALDECAKRWLLTMFPKPKQ